MSDSRQKPQIYFVFPYRGVGGVPALFVRIGEYLAAQGRADVYFVDYPDGAMARMMKPDLGTLVTYSDTGWASIPDGAYAVFQSMSPWSIFPRLAVADSVRLLFWNCHPLNLVPMLPGMRTFMQTHILGAKILLRSALLGWRMKMRAFLTCLLQQRAIVFMDENNVNTTVLYLDRPIDRPVYLPIPVLTQDAPQLEAEQKQWPQDAPIRIVWLGRIVDFKFFILKRTLLQLEAAQPELSRPIEFLVVGNGELRQELQAIASGLRHVQVRFIDTINIAELDNFLLQHADLLVAMGTSVLEGARLGIPAILLDMSYAEVPGNYHYRWLYERHGFTLADVISSRHMADDQNTLTHRLKELVTNFSFHSRRSREYVIQNHGLETVAEQFLALLAGTGATWGDLREKRLLKRGWIYPVFLYLRDQSYRRKQRGAVC